MRLSRGLPGVAGDNCELFILLLVGVFPLASKCFSSSKRNDARILVPCCGNQLAVSTSKTARRIILFFNASILKLCVTRDVTICAIYFRN